MKTGGGDLQPGDAAAVLKVLGAVAAISTLDEFGRMATEALWLAVPYDVASFNEVNRETGEVTFCAVPPDIPPEADLAAFPALLRQNPLLGHQQSTGDGAARRLSDFISLDELHALELYDRVYRHLGVEHQVAIGLATKFPMVIAFALNRRDRDFSDREVLLLNLLRPHLIQAYRNVEALAALRGIEGALAEVGKAVIVLGRPGADAGTTEWARQAMAAHFGPFAPGTLPSELVDWVAEERTRLFEDGRPRIQRPFVHERGGHQLVVRFVPGSGGRPDVLVIDQRRGDRVASELRRLGLTGREAELLLALVGGESPAAAAGALHMAESTANKHLQHIYRKLGVTSRTAAVAAAADAMYSAV